MRNYRIQIGCYHHRSGLTNRFVSVVASMPHIAERAALETPQMEDCGSWFVIETCEVVKDGKGNLAKYPV